ncbi:hypothetical protein [Methylobacterium durans]|uniref:Uncharacterized protein n=1 Tax=Methylobacterium durans TaxID=2202825 RepID=A0A2U8W4Q3_9HYPH|nr:hypothetical protein [Methylobacterium durans]AWN41095.1 hypothetical protein DK389_11880 [Methylobacterium durans]
MSHFEKSLLDADPEAAQRLADLLHGGGAPAPAVPSLAERFGAAAAGPDRKPGRPGARPRRTGARGGPPAGTRAKALVTP